MCFCKVWIHFGLFLQSFDPKCSRNSVEYWSKVKQELRDPARLGLLQSIRASTEYGFLKCLYFRLLQIMDQKWRSNYETLLDWGFCKVWIPWNLYAGLCTRLGNLESVDPFDLNGSVQSMDSLKFVCRASYKIGASWEHGSIWPKWIYLIYKPIINQIYMKRVGVILAFH